MKRTSRFFVVILALVMALSVVFIAGCEKEEGNTYTISLPTGLTGGTVTADKTSVKAGENVVITAKPDASYELDWIKFNDEEQTKTNDNKYEIKNVQKNVSVTAAFKEKGGETESMFTSFPEDRFLNS